MKYGRIFWGTGVALLVISGVVLGSRDPQRQEGPVFAAPEYTVSSSAAEFLSHKLQLPSNCSGTPLRIEGLASYEGPFAEDGSQENVMGVAALVLRNTGKESVSYGQVTVETEEGSLQFEFTALPPGAKLLVPEKNRSPYRGGAVCSARCEKLVMTQMSMEEDKIRVAANGMAGIVLENITDRTLERVYLRYKPYLSQEEVYIGGVTYRMEVGSLLPGQPVEIIPERFVWGYSAIVEICIGEE